MTSRLVWSLEERFVFHDINMHLFDLISELYMKQDLKSESKLISQTNIIICTPGRLLQHMDETWNFSCDNLKILGKQSF